MSIETTLTVVGMLLPLIVGFGVWINKLGGRVTLAERDITNLNARQGLSEKLHDGFRDQLSEIKTTLAVLQEQMTRLLSHFEDKK